MKKILIVFGTRPEAIKMAPLVKAFKALDKEFITCVCVTGQHREMLWQVLEFFEIVPDYDLDLMKPGQNLFQLSSDVLLGLRPVLQSFAADFIFIHGDTTTSAFAAIAAYYEKIPVCHIEAGLRTNNIYSPFPEEINRQITGRIATYNFAPTEQAKSNLIAENISSEKVLVTGNTVIDALLWSEKKVKNYRNDEIKYLESIVQKGKKIILITGHRRENFGNGFENICKALIQIARRSDVQLIYPVHFNPEVLEQVTVYLDKIDNVSLIQPLTYPSFVWLMKRSYLILTDSGGIQEEAPTFGKPVLVMRENTERPEAIAAGTAILVGTDINSIVSNVNLLLDDAQKYESFATIHNPYGSGEACNLIIQFMLNLTNKFEK